MGVDLIAIGYGGVARPQLRYFDSLPDVRVVAGADVAAGAREQFESTFDAPAYGSHETLLAEHPGADAATVITPHAVHREQVLACLDAGLDVYVEKPMVVGLDAAVEVVGAAHDRGRVVQVGYQRHFDPLFERLREVVQSGRIGEPHFAACYLEQDWIERHAGTWRTEPEMSGGGQLYDSGSHLLDALLWCTDARPRRVAAVMDQEEGVDVNTALAATLEREGRPVTASIGVTADGPTHPETHEGLLVVGTDGKVEYAGGELVVVETGAEPGDTVTTRVDEDVSPDAVFREKLDDFVAAVRGERAPAVPGESALPVVALTEAAYEAQERGTTVDVDARLEEARAAAGLD